MRIKLDENLPRGLAAALAVLGHDVDTVGGEGLSGGSDDSIWKAAQASGRFLITQDLDFSDLRAFTPGTHRGLLLVRLGRPGRRALVARISELFKTEKVEEWPRCFVVATERKVRVRRPSGGGDRPQ